MSARAWLSLLALLVLAGPAAASEPVGAAAPPARECTGQRFVAERIACYSEAAVRLGDPRVCLRAQGPDTRWPCVAKYAVVAGDAATCGLLPGPGVEADAELAQITVDLCLTTLALVYRKPVLCQVVRTPAMDESCLAKLVSLGADPALCRQIASASLRAMCRPDPEAETER